MMNALPFDSNDFTTIVDEAIQISHLSRMIESQSKNLNAVYLTNSKSVIQMLAELDQLSRRLRKLKRLIDVTFRANPHHPLELALRLGIKQIEDSAGEARKLLRKSAVKSVAGSDTSILTYVLVNSMYSLSIDLNNLRLQLDCVENASLV